MRKIFENDSIYRRVKDGLLILSAAGALAASIKSQITAPVFLEYRIKTIENLVEQEKKESDEIRAKYIPMIESSDKAVAVMIEQNRQVIGRLERIERKL